MAAFAGACSDVVLFNGGAHHWAGDAYAVNQLKVSGVLYDGYYQKPQRLSSRILELLRLLGLIAEDGALVRELHRAVRQFRPDFAALHYGTTALHYLRVIKRSGMRLAVVLIPNLLPDHVRSSRSRVASPLHALSGVAEQLGYRRWLRCADAIIFASSEMREYALHNYGPLPGRTCLLPDYLPEGWQAHGEAPVQQGGSARGERSVIFLGAPERYGPVIDSLDDQFLELANAKLHVYSGAMSDVVCRTGFGHIYPRFSNEDVFMGRLARFASECDAALITYNVRRREERFRSTFPTRFFNALGAGIPIAIRGGIFDACERFVKHYGIGFSYDNAVHLVRQLEERERMAAYRRKANESKGQFTAEHQSGELRTFLASLK